MSTPKKSPRLDHPIVYIDDGRHRTCSDEGIDEPIRRYRRVRETANCVDYELDDGTAEVVLRRVSKGDRYNQPRVYRTLKAAWDARLAHLKAAVASSETEVKTKISELERAKKRVPEAKARLERAHKVAAKAVANG